MFTVFRFIVVIPLLSSSSSARQCFANYALCVYSMDKEGADVQQELTKLKAKIQESREQIASMPGIDVSPAVQQQQLETLREQVRTKKQLLLKYKSLCMFEVPKAS